MKIVVGNDYVSDVHQVDDLKCLLEAISVEHFDFLLLDLFSRSLDDELLSEIKGKMDSSKIIMLTSKDNNILNYFTYYYGIKSFIFADDDYDKIERDLRASLNGNGNGVAHSSSFDLTSRECEVLKYIAEGKTSKEIAETLCISKNTVDTHRNKMLQKLNLANSPSLVKYAYKTGLI